MNWTRSLQGPSARSRRRVEERPSIQCGVAGGRGLLNPRAVAPPPTTRPALPAWVNDASSKLLPPLSVPPSNASSSVAGFNQTNSQRYRDARNAVTMPKCRRSEAPPQLPNRSTTRRKTGPQQLLRKSTFTSFVNTAQQKRKFGANFDDQACNEQLSPVFEVASNEDVDGNPIADVPRHTNGSMTVGTCELVKLAPHDTHGSAFVDYSIPPSRP